MPFWFSDWETVVRIVAMAVLFYAFVLLVLRIAGTRTLASMRAFDFVTTIALGSVFAMAVLDKTVTLVDAMLAFACITGLEFAITKLVAHRPKLGRLIGHEPLLLYYDGRFLEASLKRARITRQGVLEEVRKKGISSMEDIEAIVLEPGGSTSILRANVGPDDAFEPVFEDPRTH